MKRTRNDKTPGCPKTIWLPGVPKSERAPLWQRLTAIAHKFGCNTPASLLIAIDAGILQIARSNQKGDQNDV
jgi:hypothetical protein